MENISKLFNVFLKTNTDFKRIVLFDTYGNTKAVYPAIRSESFSDKEYFKRSNIGMPSIVSPLKSNSSGDNILVMTHPVYDRFGNFSGIIAGFINFGTLINEFTLSASPTFSNPFLLNSQDYTPLVILDKQPIEITVPIESNRQFPKIYERINGEPIIGIRRPVNDGRWIVVVERSIASILSNIHNFLLVLLATSLGVMLLLLPLVSNFASGVVKPIKIISSLSTEMNEGRIEGNCPYIDTKNSPVEVVTLYHNFCNMTEKMAEYISELKRYTSIDPLTGLANRRGLETEGARIIELCRREKTPCTCLMLDLDHFKRVNDTYGHPTGDVALQALSTVIGRNMRKSDFCARFGGEEFIIVSAPATIDKAQILAERIRADLETTPISHNGTTFSMTISIGIAPIDTAIAPGQASLEDAIQKADCALYKAKNNGRNRVEHWVDGDDALFTLEHLKDESPTKPSA